MINLVKYNLPPGTNTDSILDSTQNPQFINVVTRTFNDNAPRLGLPSLPAASPLPLSPSVTLSTSAAALFPLYQQAVTYLSNMGLEPVSPGTWSPNPVLPSSDQLNSWLTSPIPSALTTWASGNNATPSPSLNLMIHVLQYFQTYNIPQNANPDF